MEKIDSKENLIRLVNQYKNLVFSLCLKLTGDYFAAEDLTQETFVAAYTHYDSFDGQNEKAWICRIAGNKCVDYNREAARRNIPTMEEEMPEQGSSDNDPLKLYVGKEVMERLKTCCEMLPEPYCKIAVRYYIQGKTAKEIAEESGNNLKTIQTQIYRAKEMLKKYLRREDFLT